MLTEKIQREMTDLDLSVEDAYTLCYLQWIPEEAEIDVPDTSLRRMLDIDRELDLCPIESHFMFILGVLFSRFGSTGVEHPLSSTTTTYASDLADFEL